MFWIITRQKALALAAVCAVAVVGILGFGAAGQQHAESVAATADNWGLSFQQEGQPPVANTSPAALAEYGAYYLGDTAQKTIYITFDAGYENGNTAPILDALKKHGVSATFFVVGHYLETAPEMVKRMVEEGHTVGNHTYHHPDMSAIADETAFLEELTAVETLYSQITGKTMEKIYRPPQGKYSTKNLEMAKKAGYSTYFWSLAYVDWYTDKQPTQEQAYDKLLGRIHNGAVVLLHSTSSTNAAIMDELLTKWKEMGYSFGKLSDLAGV